jgi:hypothetical protein
MRAPLLFLLAVLAAVPAFLPRLGGLALPVELATLGFGVGVVGAAFAMLWAPLVRQGLTDWDCNLTLL